MRTGNTIQEEKLVCVKDGEIKELADVYKGEVGWTAYAKATILCRGGSYETRELAEQAMERAVRRGF